MIDSVITYFPKLGLICIFIGIVEMTSSVLWWRFYFSFGIPFFVRTIPINLTEMKIPNTNDIESAISINFKRSPFVVRQINKATFGFRDTLDFGLLGVGILLPVIHGLIAYDVTYSKIELRACFNWYILCFTCWFLILILLIVFESKELKFIATLLGFITFVGVSYLTHKKRFQQLTEIMHKLSS